MKRILSSLTVLLLIGVALAQAPAATEASSVLSSIIAEASQEGWLQINAETAMTQIDAIDPFVLDVRTQKEWDEQGHIPGAVLIPVTALADNLTQLPVDLNTPHCLLC